MKAFYLILLTLLLLNLSVRGQNVDDYEKIEADIEAFTKKLKIDGIDTLITYHVNYIFGYDDIFSIPKGQEGRMNDKLFMDSLLCEGKNAGYVLWIVKGETFAYKVHPCYQFDPVRLASSPLNDFFRLHPDLMRTPALETFQYKEKRRVHSYIVNHTVITNITIQLSSSLRSVKIDDMDVSKTDYRGNMVNINFDTNIKNPTYLLSETIKELLARTRFQRAASTSK